MILGRVLSCLANLKPYLRQGTHFWVVPVVPGVKPDILRAKYRIHVFTSTDSPYIVVFLAFICLNQLLCVADNYFRRTKLALLVLQ